jgi:hypothetical protein
MKYCCDRMREELDKNCQTSSDTLQCPDVLVRYVPKYDEYGLIVHDGGSSMIRISFCPWCGARFAPSKRDRWFDELERRGIDPQSDTVPSEFLTESWWAELS